MRPSSVNVPIEWTLPFQIIFLAARMSIASRQTTLTKHDSTYYSLIRKIGETFWYIDDLMDLIKDVEVENLNSILLEKG
jgi:hypothetical protein